LGGGEEEGVCSTTRGKLEGVDLLFERMERPVELVQEWE